MLLGFPLIARSHEPLCHRENLKECSGQLMQPMFRGSSCFLSTFLAYRSCQLPSSRPHMQALIIIVHACGYLFAGSSHESCIYASLHNYPPSGSVSSTHASSSLCVELRREFWEALPVLTV